MNRTGAFTLLELIVVIVIIGILGTFGFAQYQNIIEKSRRVEAIQVLKTLRQIGMGYYLEYGRFPSGFSSGDAAVAARFGIGCSNDSLPGATLNDCPGCRKTHYFHYNVATQTIAPGPGTVPSDVLTFYGQRCSPPLGGGREPPVPPEKGYSIYLQANFSSGIDMWGFWPHGGSTEWSASPPL